MRRLDGVPSTSPQEIIDTSESERVIKLAIIGNNATVGDTPRVWLCVSASLLTGEITCALRHMANVA